MKKIIIAILILIQVTTSVSMNVIHKSALHYWSHKNSLTFHLLLCQSLALLAQTSHTDSQDSALDHHVNALIVERGTYEDIAGYITQGASPLKALESAVCNNNPPVVTSLLQKGVIATFDMYRLALYYNCLDVLIPLIRNGIDVNTQIGNSQMTALIKIASSHSPTKDKITTLLSLGADPNIQDSSGRTALSYAVRNKHADIVTLLMAHGANPYLSDIEGKTAQDYAHENGLGDLETIQHKLFRVVSSLFL